MRVRTAKVLFVLAGLLLSLSACHVRGEYGPWISGCSDCPGPDCCPRPWASWDDYDNWVGGGTSCCRRGPVAAEVRGVPAAVCGQAGCGEFCPACARERRAAGPAYGTYPGAGVRVVGPPPSTTYVRPMPGPTVVRPAPGPTPPPPPPGGTLFERLGGLATIEAVVDDFTARFTKDPVILANEKVEAFVETGDMAEFRRHLVDQICQAAGGPCVYKGRDMKESHAGLGITEAEWAAGEAHLVAALEAQQVGEREKGELLAIVASTKSDIVEKP
jgi:hemoglobin